MPAAPRHLFLHHEPSDGAPPYTLKLVTAGAPLTVSDALGRFAAAYGATGHELATAGLQMEDESGKCLRADAVLPCGLSAGADAFVLSDEPPKKLSAEAAPIAAAMEALRTLPIFTDVDNSNYETNDVFSSSWGAVVGHGLRSVQFHSTLTHELLVCFIYHDKRLKSRRRNEKLQGEEQAQKANGG